MAQLFTPLTLRGLTLKNRLAVSPMCQYSARDGLATDWHLVHLGRFGLGGFGLVTVEATAVTREGRITYADLGLWDDSQIDPLRRITSFLRTQGAASAIQLSHAGGKASSGVWWRQGVAETEAEKIEFGYEQWQPSAPSALSYGADDRPVAQLDDSGLQAIRDGFRTATQRALAANFDMVEIHAAHGYLLHQFLSPLTNRRSDGYGGDRPNRMRFPLEIAEIVRQEWPSDRPLMVRISAQERDPAGWQLADSVVLARELKARGVDLIDCSSGNGSSNTAFALYQVPLAETIRREAGIAVMAIGLITDAAAAEAVVADGHADLVALARGALEDPNWPVHARHLLGGDDDAYGHWPRQIGFVIQNKDRELGERQFDAD
ncbi:NADH:flavin oxidoreductase/NADH oxidase [uncultured Devosia sp.]|uniref:NADH:flavin oxidoreductase/NADH oxidase n=1 Tax=uncultured Devosia sp. TaxID=211434 RepID=UPI0035CB759C